MSNEEFEKAVIDLLFEIAEGMHEGHECEVCADFLNNVIHGQELNPDNIKRVEE